MFLLSLLINLIWDVQKVMVFLRGVTVYKYDGSVRTSVLTSRFGMISVQQGDKLNLFFFFK